MENFMDALSYCDLTDIGFTGLPYTYDNKRVASANVKVRLDRAIADTTWRDLFGDANLFHLVSSRSDHCPLLLQVKRERWDGNRMRSFRYEIMWELLQTLAEEIKIAWCSTPNRECLGGVMGALRCYIAGVKKILGKLPPNLKS
jgi:hypothetical protein